MLKEEQQIKETEQIKMSGGSLLSGPPPGRTKAPEPAKDTVPVVQPDAPKNDAPVNVPVTPPAKTDTVPATPAAAPKSDNNSGGQSAPVSVPPTNTVPADNSTQPVTPPAQTPAVKQDSTQMQPH